MPTASGDIEAVLLAGGRATRLGGIDKGRLQVRGRPLAEYPLRVLEARARNVFVSANRSLAAYRAYGHPVLPDVDYPGAGPLAGIHEAMKRMDGEWLLVLPCDAPGVQVALLDRLLAARRPGDKALVAAAGGRRHPTFSLLHRRTHAALRAALAGGRHGFDAWLQGLGARVVDCSDHPEWFTNLNRPEEAAAAGAVLA